MVQFETESHTGSAIYHTDVMMFVGTDIIGICFDVIKPEHLDYVKEKVNQYHQVIELSADQIKSFCGNAIEAQNENGELFLIISSTSGGLGPLPDPLPPPPEGEPHGLPPLLLKSSTMTMYIMSLMGKTS